MLFKALLLRFQEEFLTKCYYSKFLMQFILGAGGGELMWFELSVTFVSIEANEAPDMIARIGLERSPALMLSQLYD